MDHHLPQMAQQVCSPAIKCFPPCPTECLFCRNTSIENCPFRKRQKEEKK